MPGQQPPADTTPAASPQVSPDFAAAFAAAAADEAFVEQPAAAEPAPAEPAPAEPAPAEPAPAEPAPDGAAAEPAPAEPAPAEPAPAEPAPAAPSADEIVKGLADLLKNPPQPEPAPTAQPEPPAPELYTPEEKAVIANYQKDWPDVARAEQLQRRAEYHDLLKFVFTEMEAANQQMREQLRQIGNAVHMTELTTKVTDYSEDLEQQVAAWVDTQPTYLQAAYKQVMQQGSSDEVADLIGRYRAATGATVPAPAATPAPAPTPAAPKPTELSSAAKQAAESLAPVSSDRTQIPVGEDPSDFKSAFDRYAAESAI